VSHSIRRTALAALRLIPALSVLVFLPGLTNSLAQSLGDLARQERARVRNNSANPAHVFTNEDLARPRILAGGEQEESDSLARIPSPVAPPAVALASVSEPPVSAVVVPVPVWPEGTPLGDVARYYRQLKELQNEPVEAPVLAQELPADAAPKGNAPLFHEIQDPLVSHVPADTAKEIPAPAAPAREDVPASTAVSSVITVNPGDSLWKLASRYLGDGNQWKEIASANPEIADPNLIRVGQQIRLPASLPMENTAVATAANRIKVQPGDSLWKLAESHWGTGLAWSCIAESNPQIEDSFRIYPGQTLALPATCRLSV
jgi:nucleoid-associated protein YgaU